MISPASNMQSVNLPQDTQAGLLSQQVPEESIWSKLLGGAGALLTSPQTAQDINLPEDVKAMAGPGELAKLKPGISDAITALLHIATLPLYASPLMGIPMMLGSMNNERETQRNVLAQNLIERQKAITGGETQRSLASAAGQEEMGRQVYGEQRRSANAKTLEEMRIQGEGGRIDQQQQDMFERQKKLDAIQFGYHSALQKQMIAGTKPSKEDADTTKYMSLLDNTLKSLSNNMMLIQTPETTANRERLQKLSGVFSTMIINNLTRDTKLTQEQKDALVKSMSEINAPPQARSGRDILLGDVSAPGTAEDYLKGVK